MERRFKKWNPPEIEHNVPTLWGWMVAHPENLGLGRYTDIGAFCYLQAEAGIEIGRHVQLGAHCAVYSVNTIDNQRGKVIIKDGARIGANSVILPNVIIGKNARVGALSLIRYGTRILPNEIWAGIPAKKIGDVANADTIL